MNGNLALVESVATKSKDQIRAERIALFEKVRDAEIQAQSILVHDDHSASVGLVFVQGMRDLHDLLEQFRDSEVRPLNTEVKQINDDYRPYTTLCKALGSRVDQLVKDLRRKQQLEREEAQRKEIERVRIAKAKAEAEAAELRRQAEEKAKREAEEEQERNRLAEIERQQAAAAQNGDEDTALVLAQRATEIKQLVGASPVAQTKEELQAELTGVQQRKAIARAKGEDDDVLVLEDLERQLTERIAGLSNEVSAVELEAKAQQAELVAATIAPTVVQQVQRTVTLPTGKKMTYTTVTVPVCLPGGLSLEGEYYRDDARLKALPDDLFVLDMARLKKRVKDGQKFEGVETTEEEVSRRGGKR